MTRRLVVVLLNTDPRNVEEPRRSCSTTQRLPQRWTMKSMSCVRRPRASFVQGRGRQIAREAG